MLYGVDFLPSKTKSVLNCINLPPYLEIALARYFGAIPFIKLASSGNSSALSTFVKAAALTTQSGFKYEIKELH